MKYFDTFTGIGGFTLAINQAYEIFNMGGITGTSNTQNRRHKSLSNDSDGNGRRSNSSIPECVGFSEIDKYASSIYQKHYPEHKNYGDITKIKTEDLPDFDLLVGGFPCQAFSIAGKRGGFEDTRGTLFFELARILRDKKPRLFVFENVKGLLSHDKGNTFKTIIEAIDELGYDCQWQVLNSKNFGVPQNRERVFIVGHLRGTRRPEVFPIRQDALVFDDKKPSISRGVSVEFKGGDSTDNPSQLFQDGEDRPIRVRRLTPTECERLQGFPDNWTEGVSDTQRYKCCGNAVTVNVVQAIMEKII